MVINSNGGSELTRLVNNNMTVCDKKDFAILLLAMIASLNFVIIYILVSFDHYRFIKVSPAHFHAHTCRCFVETACM